MNEAVHLGQLWARGSWHKKEGLSSLTSELSRAHGQKPPAPRMRTIPPLVGRNLKNPH